MGTRQRQSRFVKEGDREIRQGTGLGTKRPLLAGIGMGLSCFRGRGLSPGWRGLLCDVTGQRVPGGP